MFPGVVVESYTGQFIRPERTGLNRMTVTKVVRIYEIKKKTVLKKDGLCFCKRVNVWLLIRFGIRITFTWSPETVR